MTLFSPDMWHLTVPLAEKILRPALIYFFLVASLRVFGKRELAQLNPFDLVVLLCLSNTVQNAIIGNDNSLVGGMIGALSLLIVNYMVVRYLFRHRRLDQLIEGRPATLIEKGRVVHKELARELLTESELRTVAHRQGFSSLKEIDHCVLEPGGNFFIKGKTPSTDEQFRKEVLDRLEKLAARLESRP